MRTYGPDAEALLREADPEQLQPIGDSRYTLAEIPWCIATECAPTLCDLLERRLRMPIFALCQGLPELARIAEVAGQAAGWDAERTRAEAQAYVHSVRYHYQIAAAERRTAA